MGPDWWVAAPGGRGLGAVGGAEGGAPPRWAPIGGRRWAGPGLEPRRAGPGRAGPVRERTMVGDGSSLPGARAVLGCKTVLRAVGRVLRKSKAKPNGKKPAAEERKLYLEPEYTKSRITDFEFKELVVLPREIDLNEWLASNTTTFFHHVNLQYSTISEFCTGETCQTMAVCNTQHYWYDERGKKVKCTAPQYVDFVMSSVQKLVTDEDIFPTKYGKEFPLSFERSEEGPTYGRAPRDVERDRGGWRGGERQRETEIESPGRERRRDPGPATMSVESPGQRDTERYETERRRRLPRQPSEIRA
uniref:MOB kinase activator 2 n=1 Tax=Ornithorhynchus anatinus TaxID=9258 RepID=A0A6I8MZA1_ORNAN